jgi:uncharacterized DUF497 family protein
VQYNFEWDPGKAKENLRKHKVGFERAAEIFLDPFMTHSCCPFSTRNIASLKIVG